MSGILYPDTLTETGRESSLRLMFSGIVEGQTRVLSVSQRKTVSELVLEKPPFIESASIGDSISINGVCLTLEKIDAKTMSFALGPETLAVLGWDEKLVGQKVNIERSLRLGDRVHGHLVTGHVDSLSKVVAAKVDGEALLLSVKVPQQYSAMIWKKGCIAINGVSLTVNEIKADTLELCLIPETLKRTNLGQLKVNDSVSVEVDNLARGILRLKELGL